MNNSLMRVLIVGGYGVFGGRLARLLAHDKRLSLILAGRSLEKAQAFCHTLPLGAELLPAAFDRNNELLAQLKEINPDIVVDASGPFQNYGENPYRLVDATISYGANYLDLADGSDFVLGINQFDNKAKEKNIFAFSGVSSYPVLTAAVVRQLAVNFEKVKSITGGIAPSPYAGVGENVIRAIASYAGKKVSLTRNGKASYGYALAESHRYTISPPGFIPLKSTLFSLVDVPDLQIIPLLWKNLDAIWMGAGPIPVSLHKMLNLLARCVKYRLLPSLSFLAPVFYFVINNVRWGEHRGGMYIEVKGEDSLGMPQTMSWHLLAEEDDGPFIPSMACAAIIIKSLQGWQFQEGARSAVNDLELEDYLPFFENRKIYQGYRKSADEQDIHPLYQRLLGEQWNRLPDPIREMHNFSQGSILAHGKADIQRGSNIFSNMIAWLFRFPETGKNVPVTVEFSTNKKCEAWTRTFGKYSFTSYQSAGSGFSDRLLEERFGAFKFGIALLVSENKLSLIIRKWSFLGIPLPLFLAPYGDSYEFVQDDRFHFNVEIRARIIGLLVSYKGTLKK